MVVTPRAHRQNVTHLRELRKQIEAMTQTNSTRYWLARIDRALEPERNAVTWQHIVAAIDPDNRFTLKKFRSAIDNESATC